MTANTGIRLTDAELVERLKLLDAHEGNQTAAAKTLGLNRSAFRESIAEAKVRGLSADTDIVTPEAKLRTKLKIAQAELAQLKGKEDTAESIRREIHRIAEQSPSPPEWINEVRAAKSPGVPMVLWSDWHSGEVVDPSEIGGVNAFNTQVFHERVQKLVAGTIDLAYNHMVNPDYPGIIVCLGGDMISGNIHEELQDTNDAYLQQTLLDLEEQLIMALEALADRFGRVFVPCVVGNHGRTTKKPRMKGRVFESYEWNLYCHLDRYFRRDQRVQFFIPNETDAHFTVLGHRFLLTHGDSLGVKGGDGIIGAMGPIMRGTMKVHRSEAQIGRDFDTILMGHWHQYIPLPWLIVNGSLKGYDEFARLALRAPYERPVQAMWFVHAKYGITAQWAIYLDAKRNATENSPWVTWKEP